MKISKAIYFCLQYQKTNSKNNTDKNHEFVLGRLGTAFNGREPGAIKTEEVISFLADPSDGKKQNTKRSCYMTLSAFFNLGKVSDLEAIRWIENLHG